MDTYRLFKPPDNSHLPTSTCRTGPRRDGPARRGGHLSFGALRGGNSLHGHRPAYGGPCSRPGTSLTTSSWTPRILGRRGVHAVPSPLTFCLCFPSPSRMRSVAGWRRQPPVCPYMSAEGTADTRSSREQLLLGADALKEEMWARTRKPAPSWGVPAAR